MTTLRETVQSVLDRWDSPLSEYAASDLFEELRAALAEEALQRFTNVQQAIQAVLEQPEQQLKRIHPLDMPLEVFVEDLSTRPRSIINAEMRYFTYSGDEHIKPPFTVRHFLMFSRKEISKWPGIGKRSLNEIEELLRNQGLQLWHEHDERSLRLLREHPTYCTSPPQHKTLTDAEIDDCRVKNSEGRGAGWRFNFKGFARAIEAAHGIEEKP